MSYLDPQTQGLVLGSTWRFQTAVDASDPGQRNFKFDNVTLASVTNLYVNSVSANRGDLDNILGFLTSGDQIYAQQVGDSSRVALFTVGTPVDNTGWWTIPVTVVNSDTIMTSNQETILLMNFGG